MPAVRGDWSTIKGLLPYLWDFRGRVALALGCLFIAKLANVGVPLVLKDIVDSLDQAKAPLALPIILLIGYGLLRLSSTLFAELRDIVFAKVAQRSIRKVALKTFRHLHSLSLRFHLERQTGGMSRDVERGTRGIESLLHFAIFSIIPTLFEMALVGAILIKKYSLWFAVIILGALIAYITLTVVITEWRTHFRRAMNELDSKANTRAIDSLLNYETVKYFNNEDFETRRYDESLQRWEQASVKSQASLGPAHRVGRHRSDGPRGGRRGVRHHERGRSGARQCAPHPALHSAEFSGCDLPRDETVAGRHGEDVPAAGRAQGGG